jgi:hypothetical protein
VRRRHAPSVANGRRTLDGLPVAIAECNRRQQWRDKVMNTNRAVWIGVARVGVVAAWAFLCASAAVAGPDGQSTQSPTGLVEVVLRATDQFRDPAQAVAAGYASANSCVSGPEEGAMGVHWIKGDLVMDGQLDPQQPEALIYEHRNGKARLVGVEYIVIAEGWHTNNGAATPVLLGQQMHYVGSPNRYGLPAFYELHVWAWRLNPKGTFVDWNPRVSCAGFEPDETSSSAAGAHTHGLGARPGGR